MIKFGSNSCGENLYRVFIGTGTIWLQEFHVYAYNEQEAVDLVADYCEEHELEGLYTDYYTIADECETGQSVDEFIYEHNLTCCGNHGIYLEVAGLEEICQNSK